MRILLSFFIAAFLSVPVLAQDPQLSALGKNTAETLTEFHDKFPQEKVFLQSDRTLYAAGETVWMKAWVTLDGKPSFLSRILYIDLVNEKGEVVDKKMYQLDSLNSTACDLLLNGSLATGNYQLRAYTLWMLNFPHYIFSTPIFVLGSDRKVNLGKPGNSISAAFFPEGGNLVAGVESVVAVKIYDKYGTGVKVNNGIVKDASGKAVAGFKTDHEGMGSFTFTPQANTKYTAVPGDNVPGSFPLPAALAEGVVMKINNTSASRLSVILKKNTTNPATYNRLLIVAQMHNTVIYQGEINFEEGATAASISKKNLPPGIIQVTVFDQAGIPLAERLAFVKNMPSTGLAVNTNDIKFEAKGKNAITIETGAANKANLSLLITDAASDSISAPVNILSTLLLSSDVKGFINNPNYYFEKDDTTTNRNLDLLLLTQGWRRFDWTQLLAKKMPSLLFPVESSLAIKGSVTKPGSSTRVTSGRVDMIIKGSDSTTLLSTAELTDKGEFIIDGLNIKRQASLSYQGTNDKKQKLVVDVNLYPNYIDTLQKGFIDPGNPLSDFARIRAYNKLNSYLLSQVHVLDTLMKANGYLQNVTVRAVRPRGVDSLNKEYASGVFEFGGRKLDPGGINYFNIWQYIRTVPGFVVEGNATNPTISLSRGAGLNVFSGDNVPAEEGGTLGGDVASGVPVNMVENGIAFFLNEIPVSRDVLDNLAMIDVAYIKTYVGPEAVMIGPFNGVIAVYTHKGKAAGSSILDKAFAKTKITGYSLPRQFFSIDYSLSPDSKNLPDNRITLLWKPYLNFDANGKATVNFFNNDTPEKIRVVVQGIDNDGRIFFQQKQVAK